MQNLYVAGELMQDPSLDGQQLLDEFARGFVGEENAPALAAALRAVERARTRAALTIPKSWMPWIFAMAARRKACPSLGSGRDKRHGRRRAWRVMPSAGPQLPAGVAGGDGAENYLPELTAHLQAIRQMLVFLKVRSQGRANQGRRHAKGKISYRHQCLAQGSLRPGAHRGPRSRHLPAEVEGLEKGSSEPITTIRLPRIPALRRTPRLYHALLVTGRTLMA